MALFGDEMYRLDPAQSLLVSVNLVTSNATRCAPVW